MKSKLVNRIINHLVMTFRYVWLQKPQVIRTDFSCDLPSRILEFTPGAMKLLHFLQKVILISYGIRILCFVLIFLASDACLWASVGFFLAFETASLIRICILSFAISLRSSFMKLKSVIPIKIQSCLTRFR